MPYEPPDRYHRRRGFRLAEVNAWLEQRAASRPARQGVDAEGADVAQLASALAGATSAADAGDHSQLTDALRMLANAAGSALRTRLSELPTLPPRPYA